MRNLLIIFVFCLASGRLSIAGKDLIEENEKLSLLERLERLEKEIEEVHTENRELQEKIEDVQNAPFGYFCGHRGAFFLTNSVITYDKLLYSSQFGLQGGININTGKFVAGSSGTWRGDFSLVTDPDPGGDVIVFLYKNGEKIPETLFYSHGSDAGSGWDINTGGRSVLLHLDLGDELYLGTTLMENYAERIIFCVSLEQSDDSGSGINRGTASVFPKFITLLVMFIILI